MKVFGLELGCLKQEVNWLLHSLKCQVMGVETADISDLVLQSKMKC